MDWKKWIQSAFIAIGQLFVSLYRLLQRAGGRLKQAYQAGIGDRVGAWLDGLTQDGDMPFPRVRQAFLGLFSGKWGKVQKLICSTLLFLLAVILLIIRPAVAGALAAFGMLFSWLGDAMLMEFRPIRRWVKQYFLWGMGLFALAQVNYLSALLHLFQGMGSRSLWPMWIFFFLYALIALMTMGKPLLFNKKQPLLLRILSIFYALLICVVSALGAAVCMASVGRGWLLLLGGLLFFISDLIIALTRFGGVKLKYQELYIWGTYVPAQACLLIGVYMVA